jgi:hypothetical protein
MRLRGGSAGLVGAHQPTPLVPYIQGPVSTSGRLSATALNTPGPGELLPPLRLGSCAFFCRRLLPSRSQRRLPPFRFSFHPPPTHAVDLPRIGFSLHVLYVQNGDSGRRNAPLGPPSEIPPCGSHDKRQEVILTRDFRTSGKQACLACCIEMIDCAASTTRL